MENQKTSAYIKVLSISSSIIALYIVAQLFTFSVEPSLPIKNERASKDSYAIFSLKIPEGINFAGEKTPYEKHWVKESLDRELLINTYWQSQTLLTIKRANRYFPIIEPILKEQGIPDDFKYLAVIESGLMPRAVSPAGAAGLWQFMSSTASEYGLEVNSEVDERYHIQKSTVAACKYLKKAYESYQNWSLVAASYNAGKAGINRQLNLQQANDYYDLLLGEETGRYVYRIIALKEILSNPNSYGFYVDEEDMYPKLKTETMIMNGSISNIADFAKSKNISYKELKDLNPWLRDNMLTNSRKKAYEIDLPLITASAGKTESIYTPTETVVPNKIGGSEVPLKTPGLQLK